ncbi:hypothetical protein [Deinococcus multiflagellatus]|uniref:hypothetical protein n=1 Tax=Deinococcus multiflagellatus TaxID=1656887 RepID=UPI001CCF476F|nr:hypothetical protein [Deinococcus multiflagellatus]MBZ9713793.1 hypothetical protein [Deinococcus multiflagellatus]
MSADPAFTGSLTGLLSGGLITAEVVRNPTTGEHGLQLMVELAGGEGENLTVTLDAEEAVDVATDLLLLAQTCRERNRGGGA